MLSKVRASMWSDLDPAWQACFDLAWEAYCDDCIPIGAVVCDSVGKILARGRNRVYPRSAWKEHPFGVETAHAELEALRALDYSDGDYHKFSLYTTTEPCPMCMGTLYMSGVRSLYYAARDPFAGSVNLLGSTWYLSRKPIKTCGPDALLEMIITGIFVEQDYQAHAGVLPEGIFYQKMRNVLPEAVQFGERLWQGGDVQQARREAVTAGELFNRLALLVQ